MVSFDTLMVSFDTLSIYLASPSGNCRGNRGAGRDGSRSRSRGAKKKTQNKQTNTENIDMVPGAPHEMPEVEADTLVRKLRSLWDTLVLLKVN
jgi:hypothetical protein